MNKRTSDFMKKINKTGNRIKMLGASGAIALSCPSQVMAGAIAGGTGTNIMKTALDAIVGIFPLIGAPFVAAGAFKLINGFRNDNNPEAIAGGAKDIAIGAALIAFDLLLWKPISGAIF